MVPSDGVLSGSLGQMLTVSWLASFGTIDQEAEPSKATRIATVDLTAKSGMVDVEGNKLCPFHVRQEPVAVSGLQEGASAAAESLLPDRGHLRTR